MIGIGQAYLADIRVELLELGAMDLVPMVDSAAQGDEESIAVVAAYVAERDAKLARGLMHRWLVTGPRAGRHGTMRSTRERAEADVVCWGTAEHGWVVGYGDKYVWSPINLDRYEMMAERAIRSAA